MANHAKASPAYLNQEDYQRERQLARELGKLSKSPQPSKKAVNPSNLRVFSQMNLKDLPNMMDEQDNTYSPSKKTGKRPYDSPDNATMKSSKKAMSPLKRFQKHPNEVGFSGSVCKNRPGVSHSNFQLFHVGEGLRGREHFKTQYHNQFEDRFNQSMFTQPRIVKTLDFDPKSNSVLLSPLAQKGKIMVGKKSPRKSPKPRLGKSMEADAMPKVRYGTQRMNVVNHDHSQAEWDRVQSHAGMVRLAYKQLSPRGGGATPFGAVSVWAGIPVTGSYTKVFNRQKTFQSEWQSACFHGGVFKDPLHYHASP